MPSVFADGAPGSAADQWFARLGGIVADILHEVGVPYCKGGVMARNPQWRGLARDLACAHRRLDRALKSGRPAVGRYLLRSGRRAWRCVAGQRPLALPPSMPPRAMFAFAKLLAEAAGEVEPGITMLGNFRTENGRIDLKKTGLFGIVTTARVLAIRHHLLERSTPARLSAVATLGHGGDTDLDALARAHGVIPRPHSWAATCRYARRPAAQQQSCGQAAVARTARTPA